MKTRDLKPSIIRCFAVLWVILLCSPGNSKPPFEGTIFIESNIITDLDPTSLLSVEYKRNSVETSYDRREGKWTKDEMFIFNVKYPTKSVRFRVNSEFGNVAAAKNQVQFYASSIGRLPPVLLQDLETVTIHKGVNLYGGGNNDILIHTGQTKEYLRQDILEETLFHEACHTSLDERIYKNSLWIEAQKNDPEFISKYAEDYPQREDVAESCLMYYGLRFREDRLSKAVRTKIQDAIPERIKFFDEFVDFGREENINLRINENIFKFSNCEQEHQMRSKDGGKLVSVLFKNALENAVEIHWLDFDGNRQAYFDLNSGISQEQVTYTSHPWVITNKTGKCVLVGVFLEDGTLEINETD